MRLLILLPFMVFVLFPFYWVIITSLKTTPQISERASIFWPDPFTLEQYRALICNTPFLHLAGQFGARRDGRAPSSRSPSPRSPPMRCRG